MTVLRVSKLSLATTPPAPVQTFSGGPVFTVGTSGTPYTRMQRVNLHPNPKAGVSTIYMTGTSGSGTSTFSRVSPTTGPIASISSIFQTSVVTGSPTYLDILNTPATILPINAKASYNFSVYARSNGTTTSTLAHYISWYAGDGTSLISTTSQTGITTTSGTWQRVEFAAPTIPSNAYYAIYTVRAFSSSTYTVGDNIQASGFLIEGS